MNRLFLLIAGCAVVMACVVLPTFGASQFERSAEPVVLRVVDLKEMKSLSGGRSFSHAAIVECPENTCNPSAVGVNVPVELFQSLQPGVSLDAFYDPNEPRDIRLVKRGSTNLTMTISGAVFGAILIGLSFVLPRRPTPRKDPI